MKNFFFDQNVRRLLYKCSKNKEEEEEVYRSVERLVDAISEASNCDLFEKEAFRSIWSCGLFLEGIGRGREYLTKVCESVKKKRLRGDNTDSLGQFIGDLKTRISKELEGILKLEDFNESISKQRSGYVGQELLNHLIFSEQENFDLCREYLQAEALQQALMHQLSIEDAKDIFHQIILGYFSDFFTQKMDINLVRIMLDYRSKVGKFSQKDQLISPNKDLADAEYLHYAVAGCWIQDKLEPVIVVTSDPIEKVKIRIIALKTIFAWVLGPTEHFKQLSPGTILHVAEKSNKITKIEVADLPYESWIIQKLSIIKLWKIGIVKKHAVKEKLKLLLGCVAKVGHLISRRILRIFNVLNP